MACTKHKCPECGFEFGSSFTKSTIYKELCINCHSIASLSRKLHIKRSTLVYYLFILEAEHKVLKERKENLKGRPVIFRGLKDGLD